MMKHLLTAAILATLTAVSCSAEKPTEKLTIVSDVQKNYPVTIKKIGDGAWVHTSSYKIPGQRAFPSNGLIVQDGQDLILVDTAWGEMATVSLLEQIEEKFDMPVKKLIITHHHYDRLAGVDVLEREGAEVFTHPDTPKLSAAIGTPVPNTSVAALTKKGARTKVGPVEVAYPGPAHAGENLVVYLPAQKILFGGGIIRGGEATTLGNIADADIKAWPTSLAWIKQTYPDTKLIVPGHGKGGGMGLLDNTLKMLAAKVNAEAKTKETESEE